MQEDRMWKLSRTGDYMISEFGDIVNVETGYVLQHKPSKTHGYHMVNVNVSHTGTPMVHRIVYETFVGDIPKGLHINHLDGNKSNNHLSNLEVCTPSQNVQHAYDTGLKEAKRGSENHNAKVTEEEVLAMYELFKLGYSNGYVGKLYGLEPKYVSLIRHGRRWKHLFDEVGVYETNALGLRCELPRAVYIYNKCMTSDLSQDVLGPQLGIDPSQVSRIRTGKTWREFRKHFAIPPTTVDWKIKGKELTIEI